MTVEWVLDNLGDYVVFDDVMMEKALILNKDEGTRVTVSMFVAKFESVQSSYEALKTYDSDNGLGYGMYFDKWKEEGILN